MISTALSTAANPLFSNRFLSFRVQPAFPHRICLIAFPCTPSGSNHSISPPISLDPAFVAVTSSRLPTTHPQISSVMLGTPFSVAGRRSTFEPSQNGFAAETTSFANFSVTAANAGDVGQAHITTPLVPAPILKSVMAISSSGLGSRFQNDWLSNPCGTAQNGFRGSPSHS